MPVETMAERIVERFDNEAENQTHHEDVMKKTMKGDKEMAENIEKEYKIAKLETQVQELQDAEKTLKAENAALSDTVHEERGKREVAERKAEIETARANDFSEKYSKKCEEVGEKTKTISEQHQIIQDLTAETKRQREQLEVETGLKVKFQEESYQKDKEKSQLLEENTKLLKENKTLKERNESLEEALKKAKRLGKRTFNIKVK